MNTAKALQSYQNVGLETEVHGADPHRLILLLYQGALLAIASAKNQMMRKEYIAKGKSISHAVTIIEEGLRGSLNIEAGGKIAENLAGLYSYMTQRLLDANLQNDSAALDEVSRLLLDLRSAWENIRPAPSPEARPETGKAQSPAAPAQQQPAQQPNGIRQNALVYGRM